MSIAVMTAVWALDLPSTDKLVMLALADRADDDGHCWPGIASLTKKCSLSIRALQISLGRLEAAGYITRQLNAGKNRTNAYTLHPAPNAPRTKCTPHETTLDPAPNAPNTSRTIIKDKKATPSHPSVRAKPAFVLPDWVPADAWDGFIEMRKRKRANPTDRARQLLVAKLQRMSDAGQPPGAVLDQSTANGWTDIYELKGQANGRPHTPADLQRGKPARRQVTDNPMVLAFARMAGHIDADGNPATPAARCDATGAPPDAREYPRPALVALSSV